MNANELETVARALVRDGKGILAADESFKTINKRFEAIHLESTNDTRRSYREMLFTTPGIEEFISGVILFDETIHQTDQNETPLAYILANKGILPGIKVDAGTVDLAGFPGEKITMGLDGLRERLAEYRSQGARFTKWRAVITIGSGIPTAYCIDANAQALARFAALSQEADLVPIVEPEVLMDGDHSIERCEQVTEATLKSVFSTLKDARVLLEGMLLKPNMVLPGKESPNMVSDQAIAETTVKVLRREVPAAVPGIVFLSGGQTPQQATERLNAMNRLGNLPWQLSFSYGRALQEDALKTWSGNMDRIPEAQKVFYRIAQGNSAARYGKYSRPIKESVH